MAKTLVAYFSATGTTGVLATKLASAIGADIYEIVPEISYTNADLDWRNQESRSSVEMKDKSSRPAIGSAPVENMDQYQVIFLGFPVWWYTCPTIINTFVESYDMTGKKIVLFATSGGTRDLSGAVEGLKLCAPGVELIAGLVLNSIQSEDDLKAFAHQFN